jgi:hypothetical protein
MAWNKSEIRISKSDISDFGFRYSDLFGDRSNQDLHGAFPSQGQAAAADLEQARRTALKHLQAATGTHAQFRHAADQRRIAGHIRDVRPFAGTQHFQRKQCVGVHERNSWWVGHGWPTVSRALLIEIESQYQLYQVSARRQDPNKKKRRKSGFRFSVFGRA